LRLRVTLLAVSLGLAVSLAASLLLPRLELDWTDTFLLLYQDRVLGHIPPDPRIVMAAKLESSREGAGVTDATGDWGAAQDADLLRRLVRSGASGVAFRRPYADEDLPQLQELRSACQETGGLVAADFLHSARGGSEQLKSDLPPELQKVTPQTCVDSRGDGDGVQRRVYLALLREGQPTPSVALALYARLLNVPLDKVRYEANGIVVGERFLACERDAEGYLAWVLWPVLQAAKLQGDADIWNYPISLRKLGQNRRHRLYDKVEGRVVIAGEMMNQAFDERRTPFGKMLRFQMQAALLNTLLANWSLARPPWSLSLLVQVSMLALMTLRLVQHTSWWRRLLTAGVTAALYWLVAFGAFCWGVLLPVSGPLLGILTALGVVTLLQSSRALRALERYGGEAARLAGARMVESTFEPFERTATIMFTNLPDHLKDLERLGSPELFARRKEYSESVIRIIKRHGGRILDFQADFIMTGFNVEATREEEDHALRAIRAALELEEEVGDLKDRWLEALDPAALKAYCGICTGLVAIGWVGAKEKQSPAAIGDTTNVAARLLGAAKKMGVDILISEPTMECGFGKIVADPLPPVSLKGKTHPVPIFHARGLNE